jgi:hypothetical protein
MFDGGLDFGIYVGLDDGNGDGLFVGAYGCLNVR